MENNFIFTHHKNVDETRELYLKLSSPLQTFIEENCEITRMQNDYIFKFEFKEKFAQWLQNKGRTAYTAERINSEMERLGFESGQKGENKWRSWVGLTWKSAQ